MTCGFEAEGRITIEHYLSVFARALGIEFEDQFKKYRLWRDPDRVLEDAKPCMHANGLDHDKPRQQEMETFSRRQRPACAQVQPRPSVRCIRRTAKPAIILQ